MHAFGDLIFHEAAHGTAVLEVLEERDWSLMLLDVTMPGPNILDLLCEIRRRRPKLPLLILTASHEAEYVISTIGAGATGIIWKDRSPEDLVFAVREVLDGRTFVESEVAVEAAQLICERLRPSPHDRLSQSENLVFRRIAQGRTSKEIAFELGVSYRTIATYIARIRKKTGLRSRVDMARYALHRQLTD